MNILGKYVYIKSQSWQNKVYNKFQCKIDKSKIQIVIRYNYLGIITKWLKSKTVFGYSIAKMNSKIPHKISSKSESLQNY